jgi:hypothetical protein
MYVVLLSKIVTHLGAKGKADTTVVLSPASRVLVRVGPEQVAEQTLVRHVRGPHDPPNLLHRLKVGRKATVTAEDLLVHCNKQ